MCITNCTIVIVIPNYVEESTITTVYKFRAQSRNLPLPDLCIIGRFLHKVEILNRLCTAIFRLRCRFAQDDKMYLLYY